MSHGADRPPLVRLALPVHDKTGLRLKPLGALNAVVPAEAGQVLSSLGLLVLLKVPGRQEVGLDLVDVAGRWSVQTVQICV
jgi:hypothetical protein